MALLSRKKNKEEDQVPAAIERNGGLKPLQNTGDAYKVLIKPLVTEKSYKLGESGKYAFKVSRKANKISVRNAVEKVFGVKVARVNMISVKGKPKNFGRITSRTSPWKKAVVTLRKGEIIQGLER